MATQMMIRHLPRHELSKAVLGLWLRTARMLNGEWVYE